MTVHINGQLRDDIDVQLGGKLSQTAAHKSSSRFIVSFPADRDILECDYIQIKEAGNIICAGTVLGVEQINLGYAGPARRVYALTVSSNTDYIANVLVDMTFPAGANVQQILHGNQPGMSWYQSSLGKFQGILNTRIYPEEITLGTTDDFQNIVIEDPASLWGAYVSDVLDDICSKSNAWWEITHDKIFNMRYSDNRPRAPISLDGSAQISELKPSRDAYTLYSAVRVVGGQGKGSMISGEAYMSGPQGWEYGPVEVIDQRTIKLKYPLHSIAPNPYADNLPAITQTTQVSGGELGYEVYKVGFIGLHDNDPNYSALASYGSDTITIKDSAQPLGDLPNSSYVFGRVYFSFYPLVPVVTRLVDDRLCAEIRAQRGGTGVIEHIYKDEALTDFSDASRAGLGFLQNNSKRAKNVSFRTLVPGWYPGQNLTCDLPYYGLSGKYQVGEVAASLVACEGSTKWEYEVKASTAPYRDTNLKLFGRQSKISIKLGDDFPAVDGTMICNDVTIETRVEIGVIDEPTWENHDGQCITWQQWHSKYPNWSSWEAEQVIKELIYTGAYLTQEAKNRIASWLCGTSVQPVNLGGEMMVKSNDDIRVVTLQPIGTPYAQRGSVYSTYYLGTDQAKMLITSLSVSTGNVKLQEIPVSIDKTEDNPLGEYALTITKIDTVK